MKTKSMMLLAVAVACGLVAMLGVRQVLQKDGDVEKVHMLVAIADIPAGVPLDETNTVFKEVALESMPEGVVTKVEEIDKRALKVFAVLGEPIMLAKLGAEGSINPSVDIPPGMRVVTVAVDLTKSNSGLVRPKDRVDVLVTYKRSDETNRTISVTKTFLEFVEVFSVDSTRKGKDSTEETNEGAKNFSLLVTPEQAAIVKLAESKGSITFAMRNLEDDEKTEVKDIDDNFFDGAITDQGSREELVKEDDENKDVENFLNGEGETETVTVKKQPVFEEQEIVPPKWIMTVGIGEDVEQVEVVDEEEFQRLKEEQDARKVKWLETSKQKNGLTKTNQTNLFRSAKAWFMRAMPAEEKTESNPL
ncbi:Flp pilus assembly protein RcpC/CpaB [hydrothermal vent metagenome]|uniref:Flp pilus assembly protein RcpC/CpaB n=1 Tax=hydrothermal vent metagenome TaxID=652676 RepID=A0A3B1DJ20_9ZZZZ